MSDHLLSNWNNILKLAKFCGVSAYSIQNTNDKYQFKVTILDQIWLILVIIFMTVASNYAFYIRISKIDAISSSENFLLLVLIYYGCYVNIILNVIFNYVKRDQMLCILIKMKKLEKKISSLKNDVKYLEFQIFLRRNLIVQFAVFVIFGISQVLRSAGFYMYYIVNFFCPLSVDLEFISFIYIIKIYVGILNEKLKSLQQKTDDKCDVLFVINKTMMLFRDLHDLAINVNRYHLLIIVRLFVIFSVQVCGVFWISILVTDVNFYFGDGSAGIIVIRVLCILAWIATVTIGIIYILSSVDLLNKEVSTQFILPAIRATSM